MSDRDHEGWYPSSTAAIIYPEGMRWAAVTLIAGTLLGSAAPRQLTPPAGDGEIRVVYWELRQETEVWLTIEPKSPDGKPAPPAMILTIGRTFSGKIPASPPATFEVRASAGMTSAPRVELWFMVDGGKIDLAGGKMALEQGRGSDYLPSAIPAETLKRIAAADRITGSALGFAFELTASQRTALRTFIERATSADPAGGKQGGARRLVQ
jgi:hypothetical protein